MDALRPVGVKAWAIVGTGLVGAAAVFLIIMLKPLVIALLAALCVSLAMSVAIDALGRHGVRRGLGAGLGILLLIALGTGVLALIVNGLISQWKGISSALDTAVQRLQESAGLANSDTEALRISLGAHSSALWSGIGPSLSNLIGSTASLLVGVFVFLFTTFYMLKDGPSMVRATASWIPPPWTAQVGRIIRGYVIGLTLLGIFNATVVGIGALILGLPLIGTLVVITLLGNYVPYLGAWVAGAYAVLIALGAGGVQKALIMTVVVCLANGILQTMLQPFAYGTALSMHPLTILLATVIGGLLAGIAGVMIAAPVAAIVQHTARLLRQRPTDGRQPGAHPADQPH